MRKIAHKNNKKGYLKIHVTVNSNNIFKYLSDNGVLPCIKVIILESDWKKETYLGI